MFGYYTPDEVYEAVLMRLVGVDTDWLDVGCGHELFKSNPRLSQILAARCRSMTGIDPDPAVHQHRWLRHREQCTVEAFQADRRFDLISMRMVAEHIENPDATVGKLGELIREGGRVVVYTVNRWSPVSLLAAATPTRFHAAAKNTSGAWRKKTLSRPFFA
jgi:2-polyprenyl-3-methyl-5-hydroxy-6-metoxy-1,4-benzoquinol methylase